jgi:multiple sugar transport system permease protein
MGFVSVVMKNLGIAEELFFLKDPALVWVSVVGATCWWTMGYNMMLYVSALQDIPDQLYEAASIDGASASRQLWSITMPMLKPTHLLILMLQLIASFKSSRRCG